MKTTFSEHKQCYTEGSSVINSFLLGIENSTHGKDRIWINYTHCAESGIIWIDGLNCPTLCPGNKAWSCISPQFWWQTEIYEASDPSLTLPSAQYKLLATIPQWHSLQMCHRTRHFNKCSAFFIYFFVRSLMFLTGVFHQSKFDLFFTYILLGN